MSGLFVRKMARHLSFLHEDRTALESLLHQPVRHVAARQDIIGLYDDPQYTHLILKGWACRYKQLPDGRRAIISFFLPGDLCDPYVFKLKRMDHAIGALTPVSLIRLSPEALAEAARAHPVVEQCLWREMLASISIQREWTASIGRRSGVERLAHLFCELYLRLATVGLTEGATISMPITQPDLADALGQTSVHINRTLKELRAAGLITLERRSLTIHDLDGLQALALFDPVYLHLA